MLSDAEALATIGVKDLKAARQFYESTLGFKPEGGSDMGAQTFTSGKAKFLVYQSQFAGTNKATAATWAVADVDKEVAALKSKGVKFEQYDFPGVKREGDIHISGKIRNAWFKDPDGNILSIVNRM